jgi:hypothetical protein
MWIWSRYVGANLQDCAVSDPNCVVIILCSLRCTFCERMRLFAYCYFTASGESILWKWQPWNRRLFITGRDWSVWGSHTHHFHSEQCSSNATSIRVKSNETPAAHGRSYCDFLFSPPESETELQWRFVPVTWGNDRLIRSDQRPFPSKSLADDDLRQLCILPSPCRYSPFERTIEQLASP